jgi:hypothetical protein
MYKKQKPAGPFTYSLGRTMQVNKVLKFGISVMIITAIIMVCSSEGGKVLLSLELVDQDHRQQGKDYDDFQQALSSSSTQGKEEAEVPLLPVLLRRKRNGKLRVVHSFITATQEISLASDVNHYYLLFLIIRMLAEALRLYDKLHVECCVHQAMLIRRESTIRSVIL